MWELAAPSGIVHVPRARARARAPLAAAWIALAACGGSAPEPAAQHRALGDAPAGSPDDVVVARVDGHPVWGSCVTAQASRTGGDRAAALHDCIDFELLAWRAAARGYADDPDVVAAARTAMVGRVIDDYEDDPRAADFEPTLGKLIARARPTMHHPEFRGSSYVRAVVPDGAAPEVEAHAHDVATKIASALAPERGLSPPNLVELAQPIAAAGGITLAHQDVPPLTFEGLDPPYASALYAITEIGRTSGAIRTKWGWDVVLYTLDIPEAHLTDAEIRERVLGDVRHLHFPYWVGMVGHALGVNVTFEPDVDKTLGDAP